VTDVREPATWLPALKQLAGELVERGENDGVELVGPDGLLPRLTNDVLEAGLEAEMSEHPGYDKHDTVLTDRSHAASRRR